jgi:hypothetical protein
VWWLEEEEEEEEEEEVRLHALHSSPGGRPDGRTAG